MNSEFVEQIEHPESRYLQETQQSAYENVHDRLNEHHMTDVPERVLEKLTYTYYHDWEQNDPSYFFLLADPGVPGEHVVFEASAYADLDTEDYREKVHIDQRFDARWLAKKKTLHGLHFRIHPAVSRTWINRCRRTVVAVSAFGVILR